jgi:hypothetical protein
LSPYAEDLGSPVSSGTDISGLFGPQNGDLTSESFTLVFTPDDAAEVQNTATLPRRRSLFTSITGITSSNPATATATIGGGYYQKGLGQGLTAVAAFTWSKNLTNVFAGGGPQNVYNQSQDQAYSDYDTPKRMTVGFNWKIPVGQGSQLLPNLIKPLDLVLGGWALSSNLV